MCCDLWGRKESDTNFSVVDRTRLGEVLNPGCSLEGMMLKLKLQYFGPLIEELTHWKRL